MQKKGCTNITLCNRSQDKSEELAEKFQIPTLLFSDIEEWTAFDWIILATKAPRYLIHNHKNQFFPNPKLIIDLSLPRNADPRLGKETSIQLLNIDQINRMLKFRRKWLDAAFNEAELAIAKLVERHSLLLSEKYAYIMPLADSA